MLCFAINGLPSSGKGLDLYVPVSTIMILEVFLLIVSFFVVWLFDVPYARLEYALIEDICEGAIRYGKFGSFGIRTYDSLCDCFNVCFSTPGGD